MTAGIQPSVQGLNVNAGQLVLNARNALQSILFFNDYLQDMTQDGLVSLGYSPDDAATLLAVFENLAAVANTCMGEEYAGPPLPFNFLAQTTPLWGGQ